MQIFLTLQTPIANMSPLDHKWRANLTAVCCFSRNSESVWLCWLILFFAVGGLASSAPCRGIMSEFLRSFRALHRNTHLRFHTRETWGKDEPRPNIHLFKGWGRSSSKQSIVSMVFHLFRFLIFFMCFQMASQAFITVNNGLAPWGKICKIYMNKFLVTHCLLERHSVLTFVLQF